MLLICLILSTDLCPASGSRVELTGPTRGKFTEMTLLNGLEALVTEPALKALVTQQL